MTDHERLTSLLLDYDPTHVYDGLADYLIERGVTFGKEDKPTGWISVKDRLPEPFESVLILVSIVDAPTYVTIGGYDRQEKIWQSFTSADTQLCDGEFVTHWKPLPAPPDEGGAQDG